MRNLKRLWSINYWEFSIILLFVYVALLSCSSNNEKDSCHHDFINTDTEWPTNTFISYVNNIPLDVNYEECFIVTCDCACDITGVEAERLYAPKLSKWTLGSRYVYVINSNMDLQEITDAEIDFDFKRNTMIVFTLSDDCIIPRVDINLKYCSCGTLDIQASVYDGPLTEIDDELFILSIPKNDNLQYAKVVNVKRME